MNRETMLLCMEQRIKDCAHRSREQYGRSVSSALRTRHRRKVQEDLVGKLVAWSTLRTILEDRMSTLDNMVEMTKQALTSTQLDGVERTVFTQFVRLAEGG